MLDHKSLKRLIALGKPEIKWGFGILTVHFLLGKQAKHLGAPYNDFCNNCFKEEEDESLEDLFCNRPAFCWSRF